MSRKRSGGYTLIELMMAVGIIGIIIAIGSFNFLKMAPTYKLRGSAEQVMARMQLVKMRAVATNKRGWWAGFPTVHHYTGFIDTSNYGTVQAPEFPRAELDLADTLLIASTIPGAGSTIPAFKLPPGIEFGLPAGYTSGPGPDGIPFPSSPIVTLDDEGSVVRYIGFNATGLTLNRFGSGGLTNVPPGSSSVVFLKNSKDEGYAVAVALTGRIRLYRWSGGQWR